MKEDQYFRLRYKKRLTDYSRIDEFEGFNIGEASKKYKSIDAYYASKLRLSTHDFKELQAFFGEFHSLYSRYYNPLRSSLFKDYVKFLKWYKDQNNCCGYCKVSQSELDRLVQLRNGNLTLNGKIKRSKGTLEIEKRDSSMPYTYENSILCCPLCNNAKSNLISENDWRDYFVPSMKSYYKSLLGHDIGN
tara:strand:+ start:5193 stop:5762 length:570 start_codon:yes stop_codon:yes gene_type:complete